VPRALDRIAYGDPVTSLTAEDKEWIVTRMEELRGQVRQDLEGMRREMESMRGEIEETETKLLRAFHDWASPADLRARAHNAVLRAVDLEIESLADRVKTLERRNNTARRTQYLPLSHIPSPPRSVSRCSAAYAGRSKWAMW